MTLFYPLDVLRVNQQANDEPESLEETARRLVRVVIADDCIANNETYGSPTAASS